MRRAVAAFIVALTAVLVAPAVGGAQAVIDADFNQRTSVLTSSIGVAGGGGAEVWTRPVATTYSRAFSTYCVFTGPGCVPYHYACNPAGDRDVRGLPVDEEFPEAYNGRIVFVSFSPLSGQPFSLFSNPDVTVYCAGPRSPGVSIPAPPTTEEIWREAQARGSGPVVELRPSGRGLTGLTTPLWLSMSPVQADDFVISVNGWTVQGTVRLERVEWRISDTATDSVVAAEGAIPPGAPYGSFEQPLETFRFRTKGGYTVTGTAVWSATGTISYQNILARRLEFPEAGLSTSYEYPVSELVGVLDRPD